MKEKLKEKGIHIVAGEATKIDIGERECSFKKYAKIQGYCASKAKAYPQCASCEYKED